MSSVFLKILAFLFFYLYKEEKGGIMHSLRKTNESGRTLLEILAILTIMGIVSVGGLVLYSKSMHQIRANDITNETSKLFAARNQRNLTHKSFYVGTEHQKKTHYKYGLRAPRPSCDNKIMVGVGAIRNGDRAIDSKVCRLLFKSLENDNSPIKDIYQYDTCTKLTIADCSDSAKISALDFEFKNP